MNAIANILHQHPEMAVFLALAPGFLIGRLKIGSFKMSALPETLFAGVLIGQLKIQIPPVAIIFFSLFLFATGYKGKRDFKEN